MGSLRMPLLGSVAANDGDARVAELLRAGGLAKSRWKLERHLAAVQCILLDPEAKSRTNTDVRRLIKDIKTAACQADDVLDDFRCEALRHHAVKLRPHFRARKVRSRPTFLFRVRHPTPPRLLCFHYLFVFLFKLAR